MARFSQEFHMFIIGAISIQPDLWWFYEPHRISDKESKNLPGGGENCEAARRYGCRSLCVDVFGMKLWIPNFKCHHHGVFICLYIDVYLKHILNILCHAKLRNYAGTDSIENLMFARTSFLLEILWDTWTPYDLYISLRYSTMLNIYIYIFWYPYRTRTAVLLCTESPIS